MSLIPVILSGGEGSRLWPVSRLAYPKPFIRLRDGQSVLQKNFLKAVHLPDVKEVLTVTNDALFFKTVDDYEEVNHDRLPLSFLLEPIARNTAAAIIGAALYLQRCDEEASTMLVLPADHLIRDDAAFTQAVADAIKLAADDHLVTFGIRPEYPETGYGYIQADRHRVLQFVEKPSLEKAQAYSASKDYFWNSGMFCFKVATLLAEARALCPDIYDALTRCISTSTYRTTRHAYQRFILDTPTFEAVRSDSIDYAILEKSSRVAMVPCDIGWKDIGSWESFASLTPKDDQGNQVDAEVLLDKVSDCYIKGEADRLIVGVNLRNLMIVDTTDALLIAEKGHGQTIKTLYHQLKQKQHKTHEMHQTVHRPWGTYTTLEQGTGFKIKQIEVRPNGRLSLQQHQHRSEHWVVVSGTALVVKGDEVLSVAENESIYIPAGTKHQLENPTTMPLILIEVQCGHYLEEDDIVRFDDVYGRT